MGAGKMHADEVEIDAGLVRRLLAAQFPEWARLAIERVESSGTDNAIFRLGDVMAVRMPRRFAGAVAQVELEARWLPVFAPLLSLATPVPLAKGAPGEGYPFPWAVCTWMEGENATLERIDDPCEAARELAAFVVALRGIDTAGAPAAAPPYRGVPLALRDAYTRDAIERSRGLVDIDAVTAAWDVALREPVWDRAGVWIHGDLQPGNVLVHDGRLSAVIDFGCLNVGDPAYDTMVAWSLFSGESRAAYRAAVGVDDATWARGRGLALSVAMVQLPYYIETNLVLAAQARRVIAEVLGEVA